MYNNSNFNDNIFSDNRRLKVKLIMDIGDTTIDTDNKTYTYTNKFDFLTDVTDIYNDSNKTNKYITNEIDKVVFNNNTAFYFADETKSKNNIKGYTGSVLSGINGIFTTYPVIAINYDNTHSTLSTIITFDDYLNDYAVEFDIKMYGSDGILKNTLSVTNNVSNIIQITNTNKFYDFKKIELVIKKWSHTNRYARVSSIKFLGNQIFENDKVLNLNLNEECNLFSNVIPINTLTVKIDNSEGNYDIRNTNGYYKFLNNNQDATLQIGVTNGNNTYWTPIGKYYLQSWKSNEGVDVEFNFANRIAQLESIIIPDDLGTSTNVKSYVTSLFNANNITDYVIDNSLSNNTINTKHKQINLRQLLQQILMANKAIIYVDRDNTIQIKVLELSSVVYNQISSDDVYQNASIDINNKLKNVYVYYYNKTDINNLVENNVIVTDNTINDGKNLELKDNIFINDSTTATNVANWILNMRKYIYSYNLNYRGNPLFEMYDNIEITNKNMKGILTKHKITFNGGLTGEIQLLGKEG